MSHALSLETLDSTRILERSDADLLASYVACRDNAAFAALMARHERAVEDVCWHVLRHRQDVEDACLDRANASKSHNPL